MYCAFVIYLYPITCDYDINIINTFKDMMPIYTNGT